MNVLYQFLQESQVGFEQFFFDWYGGEASAERAGRSPEAEKYDAQSFGTLRRMFESCEPIDRETLNHRYFQHERPCTLLIDEIESIWDAIAQNDDWSRFEAKLSAIDEMRNALARPMG